MADLQRMLTRVVGEVETAVDWVRYRARRRGKGPYRVVAYRGHGTRGALHVSGRVLEGDPIPSASRHDSAWRNLFNTLRRLESDEVPAARVRARFRDTVVEALTDDEGYFRIRLDVPPLPLHGPTWQRVELELLDPAPAEGEPVRETAWVIVPPPEARFGVISDIDDTVVRTDVASLLSMLRLVFLTNAHTRLPFEGVSAFYRALHAGPERAQANPVFYVSSSPWNLYDLLHEVFEVHGIPAGPLFLKDYGIARDVLLSTGHREHKLEAIEHLLETHPELPWVLIGDSGQEDPEIYREVVRRHPGRVLAVYIRDVSDDARDRQIHAIAEEMRRAGVDTVLAPTTVAAARHAAERGLIAPDALETVRRERAAEREDPAPPV